MKIIYGEQGAVIQEVAGQIGMIILVIALTMGIFTGLNGFIMAGSRLIFAMSRAKILPKSFGKLHPKYKTPHVAIIFTIVISAAAPWFGREALVWVVDMSSIGVSIAYLYTCITAYTLFKWTANDLQSSKEEISPIKKAISLIGILASVIFIGLLLIPGSPAFLGIESRIALLIWTALGVAFYLYKRKEYNSIPKEELDYLILGDTQEKKEIK